MAGPNGIGGGSGPAKGTYAYAKSQNKDIDKLIKQRKGLKEGTKEYNAVQNEINKAYGRGPTNRPTGGDTPSSKPSAPAPMQSKTATKVSSGASSSKELATGVGGAAKDAAEAPSGAKAVKSTTRRAERLRPERSDRRAAKFRPGGKKYVGEDRLERESSRGPAGEARVELYEKKRARQANRRDIRGKRRAGRMELRAQKSEGRAALKAKSREAAEERKNTYSRAGGGKVYMKGGKMEEKYMMGGKMEKKYMKGGKMHKKGGKTEKYLLGGVVAGALAKKALKGSKMGDKIGKTKIGGMLGFEKGGKMYKKGGTVAQGASKKDVRREKKQARKSGRKA